MSRREAISSSITANKLGTACKIVTLFFLKKSLSSSIAFDTVASATIKVAPAK